MDPVIKDPLDRDLHKVTEHLQVKDLLVKGLQVDMDPVINKDPLDKDPQGNKDHPVSRDMGHLVNKDLQDKDLRKVSEDLQGNKDLLKAMDLQGNKAHPENKDLNKALLEDSDRHKDLQGSKDLLDKALQVDMDPVIKGLLDKDHPVSKDLLEDMGPHPVNKDRQDKGLQEDMDHPGSKGLLKDMDQDRDLRDKDRSAFHQKTKKA